MVYGASGATHPGRRRHLLAPEGGSRLLAAARLLPGLGSSSAHTTAPACHALDVMGHRKHVD